MNKAKNSIFASFIRKATMRAYAAGAVTTATSTENGGVKLTDGIRMVYSKEIGRASCRERV